MELVAHRKSHGSIAARMYFRIRLKCIDDGY